MNILSMQNIRKSFGETEVLKDISLSVSEGQVTAIIGPSGSGKSTLLRCATLLETIDGGSIRYLDMDAAWEEGDGAKYASPAVLKKVRACFGRRRPIPASSPAASSSGWPSPGPWP